MKLDRVEKSLLFELYFIGRTIKPMKDTMIRYHAQRSGKEQR